MMKQRTMRSAARGAAAVLLAAAALVGCDRATGPDNHADAVGVVITDLNGTQLVRVSGQGAVDGSLTVAAGGEAGVRIHFLDSDGDRFQLGTTGSTRMAIRVANTAVAGFEAHGDHHELLGRAAGATTVVVAVEHGSHDDYRSPAIPIVVTP